MKKYFIGMIAIVVAVGLSAFSLKSSSTTTDDAYWYKVENNELVEELGGTEVIISRETAATLGECDEGEVIECALGFLTPQPLGEVEGDVAYTIMKSNN